MAKHSVSDRCRTVHSVGYTQTQIKWCTVRWEQTCALRAALRGHRRTHTRTSVIVKTIIIQDENTHCDDLSTSELASVFTLCASEAPKARSTLLLFLIQYRPIIKQYRASAYSILYGVRDSKSENTQRFVLLFIRKSKPRVA